MTRKILLSVLVFGVIFGLLKINKSLAGSVVTQVDNQNQMETMVSINSQSSKGLKIPPETLNFPGLPPLPVHTAPPRDSKLDSLFEVNKEFGGIWSSDLLKLAQRLPETEKVELTLKFVWAEVSGPKPKALKVIIEKKEKIKYTLIGRVEAVGSASPFLFLVKMGAWAISHGAELMILESELKSLRLKDGGWVFGLGGVGSTLFGSSGTTSAVGFSIRRGFADFERKRAVRAWLAIRGKKKVLMKRISDANDPPEDPPTPSEKEDFELENGF